ncbi:MAG TPA: hypothetical protein VLG10_09430 [Methylomirabilota bacterium]|nr:hypothetical protein [Methylomirabilota bacterium]
MAAKKPKKARRGRKPERVIREGVRAGELLDIFASGEVKLNKTRLAQFRKDLEKRGIRYPKVQFVAKNAPFMRRPPVPAI